MIIEHSIQVTYEKTNDAQQARVWLNSLPDLIAADFETAVRYTSQELEEAKANLENPHIPKKDAIYYKAMLKATALGHPSHCTITHCSIAWTKENAYVFIIDNQDIADVVLDFLVETEKTQVWHNYSYDGRFLRYYAGKDAKNVEDTQIFAKTLLNHVDVLKARTGLKELAGDDYGAWGITADNFVLSQQYEEHVIKYAAIDACATYKLWQDINKYTAEY
jgi:hypothetical protein